MNQPPPRSWLFVSGARPEHFDKAIEGAADAIVFDLEDSVPDAQKSAARDHVVDFLRAHGSSRCFVRTNAPDGAVGATDMRALRTVTIGGIRLPKVESAAQLDAVAEAFGGKPPTLQATIESARGVVSVDEIAASPHVGQLCLGEADLSADLGLVDRELLAPVRIQIVVHSRAAGLPGPVLSPHSSIDDLDGLVRTTQLGRSMGFSGRSALHPSQVEPINSVYAPDADSLAWAEDVLAHLDEHARHGRGASRRDDGQFIDLATGRLARRLLADAGRIPPDATSSFSPPHTTEQQEAGTYSEHN